MNSKMRSSVMGLILSLFSSPLPEVQKEPVAYLYNGVQLPDINTVWTDELKAEYSYVAIGKSSGDGYEYYHCIFMDSERSMQVINGENEIFFNMITETTKYKNYTHISDRWVSAFNNRINPIWANYDVLDVDGSVYLKASEPIPVYE